jgi:hypothetical protein
MRRTLALSGVSVSTAVVSVEVVGKVSRAACYRAVVERQRAM